MLIRKLLKRFGRPKATAVSVSLFETLPTDADASLFVRLPADLASYAASKQLPASTALRSFLRAQGNLSGISWKSETFIPLNEFMRCVELDLERIFKGFFDFKYYRNRYEDIKKNKIDPLEHYFYYGSSERRDPAEAFSTSAYFDSNPDHDAESLPPLLHYILIGRHTGASPVPVSLAQGNGDDAGHMRLDHRASTVSSMELRRFGEVRRLPALTPPGFFDRKCLHIHWVIPDFSAGGGGHTTIFRVCNWLEQRGHTLTIWIRDPSQHRTPEDARTTLFQHFFPLKATIRFLTGLDDLITVRGDAIIATDAFTVPFVLAAGGFKRKFYFVQDHETRFSPPGARNLLADSTYHEDLDCICAGSWLRDMMRQHGRWAASFDLAADRTIYQPDAVAPSNETPIIAFYCRMFTERRAVELGLLALEILARRGIKFRVELFGQSDLPFSSAPFAARNLGVCDAFSLADLYRRADVGVVFSATNYSLVPQEMMAAGLPVVDLDLEGTRAVYREGAITLATPTPEGIADAIAALLLDPERRQRQRARASEWVGTLSWERSCEAIEKAIIERLENAGFSASAPAVHTRTRPLASVVIPTYNGGALLERVVDQVVAQHMSDTFEVLCIDSSSSDGSIERIREKKGVRVEVIPQHEFQHGRTRNLGVELTEGEYVAFLTQDALPVDHAWLHNLVAVMHLRSDIGGVFGRHRAYASSSAFIQRDIEGFFSGLQGEPLIYSLKDGAMAERAKSESGRQLAHYYSDNNSCLRRPIWKQVRIPDVSWGEDQAFAWQLLQAGFAKAYANAAVVYHSHDDAPEQIEPRAYEEAQFFYQYFGYRPFDSVKKAQGDLEYLDKLDALYARKLSLPAEVLARRQAQNGALIAGKIRAMQDLGAIRPE